MKYGLNLLHVSNSGKTQQAWWESKEVRFQEAQNIDTG